MAPLMLPLRRFLHTNHLTGAIPSIRFPELSRITLSNNTLTNRVPWEALITPRIKLLALADNHLDGTIPMLPSSLEGILFHSNRFSGDLPSFENHTELVTLTLHDNQLLGELTLPNSSKLRAVLAHRNRSTDAGPSQNSQSLSAQTQAVLWFDTGQKPLTAVEFVTSVARHYATCQHSAPEPLFFLHRAGNMFRWPIPVWAAMANVPFMYAEPTVWRAWSSSIIMAATGSAVMFTAVAAVLRQHVTAFVSMASTTGHEGLQRWCAKCLAMGSAVLVMVPLYYLGAKRYACGKVLLHTTMAYLDDSPAIEWCVAMFACVFFAWAAWLAAKFKLHAHAQLFDVAQSVQMPTYSWPRMAFLWVCWALITLVCCIPTLLYGHNPHSPPPSLSVTSLSDSDPNPNHRVEHQHTRGREHLWDEFNHPAIHVQHWG